MRAHALFQGRTSVLHRHFRGGIVLKVPRLANQLLQKAHEASLIKDGFLEAHGNFRPVRLDCPDHTTHPNWAHISATTTRGQSPPQACLSATTQRQTYFRYFLWRRGQ